MAVAAAVALHIILRDLNRCAKQALSIDPPFSLNTSSSVLCTLLFNTIVITIDVINRGVASVGGGSHTLDRTSEKLLATGL